jgi:hypothetical protein
MVSAAPQADCGLLTVRCRCRAGARLTPAQLGMLKDICEEFGEIIVREPINIDVTSVQSVLYECRCLEKLVCCSTIEAKGTLAPHCPSPGQWQVTAAD